ncbi:hypothetical protein BACCAC_03207 [Bacteroides caccae ATCC 43185]|nr:hypothetical protein BACCAC_03207 [Bacteroides caccae ATCC 43185]
MPKGIKQLILFFILLIGIKELSYCLWLISFE